MSYQIEQTILLRDYLKELPISQAMIKRIKREGDFLVNGKSQTVRCLLQKRRLFRNYFSNRKLKYSTRKYSFKNHL